MFSFYYKIDIILLESEFKTKKKIEVIWQYTELSELVKQAIDAWILEQIRGDKVNE